jgi:hypothetical protein
MEVRQRGEIEQRDRVTDWRDREERHKRSDGQKETGEEAGKETEGRDRRQNIEGEREYTENC